MTETLASHAGPSRSMVHVVLQTALLVGTLNISAAIINFYWRRDVVRLQFSGI